MICEAQQGYAENHFAPARRSIGQKGQLTAKGVLKPSHYLKLAKGAYAYIIHHFGKNVNIMGDFKTCTGGGNRTPSSAFGELWFTINRHPQFISPICLRIQVRKYAIR